MAENIWKKNISKYMVNPSVPPLPLSRNISELLVNHPSSPNDYVICGWALKGNLTQNITFGSSTLIFIPQRVRAKPYG